MPEISRFFGIIIAMFYSDHAHLTSMFDTVSKGTHRHRVAGRAGSDLSPRVLGLVIEWAQIHKAECGRTGRCSEPPAAQGIAPWSET